MTEYRDFIWSTYCFPGEVLPGHVCWASRRQGEHWVLRLLGPWRLTCHVVRNVRAAEKAWIQSRLRQVIQILLFSGSQTCPVRGPLKIFWWSAKYKTLICMGVDILEQISRTTSGPRNRLWESLLLFFVVVVVNNNVHDVVVIIPSTYYSCCCCF